MRNDNGRVSVFIAVLFSGLVFVGLAAYLFATAADYSANGEKTDATITRIEEHFDGDDTDYYVYVEFYVDGVKYSGLLGVYEAGFREGKTIPVLYKRDNPKEFIYGKRNNFIAALFFAAGLFMLFLTAGYWAYKLLAAIKLAIYKRNGNMIRATVTRKELSARSFLGRNPALVSFTGEEGLIYEKRYIFGADELKEGDEVNIYVKVGGESFAVENINKSE